MGKVCFFNSVKFWGGGEKFYLDYAEGLSEMGHKIIVGCGHDSELSKRASEKKIPQFNINVSMFSFLNPFKLIKMVRFLKREEIDTILFSTSQDFKFAGIAAKMAGVKKIALRRGLAKPMKNRFLNRYIFQNVLTHIIANSEETKRTILKNLSDYVDADKIRVIYNGIKMKDDSKTERTGLDHILNGRKGVVLGNVGRLTAQKEQHYLIEVAKILKERRIDFTLFIAGSGELEEELREMIVAHNLENEVILLGFVKDVNAFMSSIDIFLLSSAWEGFGYVLVEAMAQSVPVIAFDITSNPEIVLDNKSGFLIEYPDTEFFAKRTEQLIKDAELRTKMGEAGRKDVMKRFQFAKSLEEVANYLIKE